MKALVLLGVSLALGIGAHAQEADRAAPRAFEVVSVKENTGNGSTGYSSIDLSVSASQPAAAIEGTITIRNIPLCNLIARAHELGQLQRFLLFNGTAGDGVCAPGHSGFTGLLARRFDIVAKAPAGSRPVDVFAMLRTTLVERFTLKIRRQQREMPVYALMPVRPGQLGPRLAPSTLDCAEVLRQDPALEPRNEEGRPVCREGIMVSRSATRLRSSGTLTRLARSLQSPADRIVVDLTSLTGLYQWRLDYSPPAAPDGQFPSVYTAVREQLGLKLEPQRRPVEVLVIEHIEPPTPD